MGVDKKLDHDMNKKESKSQISRRGFMGAISAATAGTVLSSCKKKSTEPDPPGVNPNETGDVALAKLANYDYDTLKSKLETMFTQVGGFGDVISSGDKVAIKINLTGGNSQSTTMLRNYGCSAEDSVWTHSSVLRAVGELLIDAGAGQLYIVEGQSDEAMNNPNLGYGLVKLGLGAQYINLNNPNSSGQYTDLPVNNGFNFDKFTVNPILAEVDKYVTIPKMKCHFTAGITLSMKNNVGMVPGNLYGDGTRWNLHGPNRDLSAAGWHLPQTIVDLNLARPVDLTIIDGINTMDKGEGPWVPNAIAPVNARALVVSKDAVKADAIGMQVMGFDPMVDHYEDPFVCSDNWLRKAQEKGLGDPNPENIVAAGNFASDFTYQFHPCDENSASLADAGIHRLTPYCGQFPKDEHHHV